VRSGLSTVPLLGNVLRVAVDSAEAPPALIDQADVIVDGSPGLLEFLRRLLV